MKKIRQKTKRHQKRIEKAGVKEKTKMTIELDGEYTLVAYSTVVLKKGYTAIFKDIKAEEVTELSSIADGMYSGTAIDARFEEKETKPPSRYTKACLLYTSPSPRDS